MATEYSWKFFWIWNKRCHRRRKKYLENWKK